MQKSIISWTNKSWNPTSGCSKVSDGCKHCYAEALSLRYGWSKSKWTIQNEDENVVMKPHKLVEPFKEKDPIRIFVNSMSDAFHRSIPDWYRAAIFCVMLATPQHVKQILTKRPELAEDWDERFLAALQSDEFKQFTAEVKNDQLKEALNTQWQSPWADHIWMGASVEDARVLHRLDSLRRNKAHVRFVSAEPLIGAWGSDVDLSGIHWIIVGGESGNHMTPDNPRWMQQEWAREIKNQCVDQGVAFFYKQDSGVRTEMRPYLVEPDGSKWAWAQYPGDIQPPRRLNGLTNEPLYSSVDDQLSMGADPLEKAQFQEQLAYMHQDWQSEAAALAAAWWYEQAHKQCQRVPYVKVVDPKPQPPMRQLPEGYPFKKGDILKDWQGRIGEVCEDQYSGLAHVTLLDKAGNPSTRKHWQTGEPGPNRADFTVCEKIEYAGYHLNPEFPDTDWGSAPRKVDVIQQPAPPDEPEPPKPTFILNQLVTVEGSTVIGKITDLDNLRYPGKVFVKRPNPAGSSYMGHWIVTERVQPAPEGAVFNEIVYAKRKASKPEADDLTDERVPSDAPAVAEWDNTPQLRAKAIDYLRNMVEHGHSDENILKTNSGQYSPISLAHPTFDVMLGTNNIFPKRSDQRVKVKNQQIAVVGFFPHPLTCDDMIGSTYAVFNIKDLLKEIRVALAKPAEIMNDLANKSTTTIQEIIQPAPESAPVITTVVNFQHVKQHWNKDTQTWDDPKYVYCGRRNPSYRLPESPFANRSPEKNVASFIKWFPQQPAFQRIEELRGKTLVCWCKPDDCHCDVFVELLNSGRNYSYQPPQQPADVFIPLGAMALTLWEPYGMLINVLAKQWETRDWETKYRGPLVICTAKKRDREILDSYTALRPLFRKYDVAVEPCRFGMALCLVDLTDCIPAEIVPEDEQRFGNFAFGRWAWKLENVRRFREPIPVSGHQRLWKWVDPRPAPSIHLDRPADISPDTSRVTEADKTADIIAAKNEDVFDQRPKQLALLW